MDFEKIRHSKWFDLAYRVGVAIKGFDGLVELATGIALLVSPSIVHNALTALAGHAERHGGHAFHFISTYVARLDEDLARSGLAFLVIFLIGHGVVKLVLVYCLLRRIVWAYPYALIVLILFAVYQVYVIILDPGSLGLWFFLILDIVIVWLVYGEWKDLKEKVVEKKTDKTDTKKHKKVVK